jgi:hypothetical protein
MISELLDKRFVVESMNWLRDGIRKEAALLKQDDPDAKKRSYYAGTSKEDLDEAEDAIDQAREEEARSLTAPNSSEPFFPRDRVAALVQSQLHQFFEFHDLVQEPQGQGLAPDDIPVANRSLRPGALVGPSNKLFEAFGPTDAGWVSCKIAEAITRFKGRHSFSDDPPRIAIGNNARLILVADWATAIPRAQLIGSRMRQQLLHADATGKERHVIHLGDVYYSGYRNEYNNHFLHDWPVLLKEESAFGSWCLNANHDMFSGGRDYFGFLLKQPRFRRHNGCSYFCLENDDWQIFALDTGYDEYDLHGNQAHWIEQIRAEHPEKKAMLLSHHQPFSLYGEQGSPKVLGKLKKVLETDKVRAWFWGHEHRCVIYQPSHHIQSPRLIGNGGVPVWAPTASKPAGVEFEYALFVESGLEKFLKFGFAVLDFERDKIGVKYIGENGQPYWSETLS